jgi:hypothetical protein
MATDAEAIMEAEFARLYSMLRLTPACTPDDLHRAYRRAIAELHPDRGAARSADQDARLRDLITLHAEATEFHRRHGRLPGANPGLHPRHSRRFMSRPPSQHGGKRSGQFHRWLIFLPLLAFVAWQLVEQDSVPSETALDPPESSSGP